MKAITRTVLISLVLIAGSVTLTLAEEIISIGDSADRVLSILGKPRGKMGRGNSESWSYQRGVVRITDGRVTYVNIYSKEDAQAKEAERKAIIKNRAIVEQSILEEKTKNNKLGTEEKNAKLKDEEFLKLPPEEQLTYWNNFKLKFKEVDVSTEIAALTKQPAKEDEVKELSERETLLETIETKQTELDALIAEAKTKSAGRTYRLRYMKNRKKLEDELVDLREKLRSLPKE